MKNNITQDIIENQHDIQVYSSNQFSIFYLMDIKINLDTLKDLESTNYKLDAIKFQKMLLLYNTIEQGWSVKKRNDSYVFTKNHENKKEILDDSYLMKFMKTCLDLNKLLS